MMSTNSQNELIIFKKEKDEESSYRYSDSSSHSSDYSNIVGNATTRRSYVGISRKRKRSKWGKRLRNSPSSSTSEEDESQNNVEFENETFNIPGSIDIEIASENDDEVHTRRRAVEPESDSLVFAMSSRLGDDDSSYSGDSADLSLDHGSDDEDEEYDDDGEEVVIDKIIARRTDSLKNWLTRCDKMNTSEIENGSLWRDKFSGKAGDKFTECNEDLEEERFLVKWADLSFLHCSWEVRAVLLQHTSNGKLQLENFQRRYGESGCRFDVNDRSGGEYFDPRFMEIDRIIDIKDDTMPDPVPIILDKSHANYDMGTGSQFLVKWKNMPYSESTYEHERDLVIMKVEYESHRGSFSKRHEKPDSKVMKNDLVRRNRTIHQLRKSFRTSQKECKNGKIDVYVKELEEEVFPNGGRLKSFQAEGVGWLVANYVNRRSSILADVS